MDGVGDHLGRQDVIDGQRDVLEHGERVGIGGGSLVGSDLGQRAFVPPELRCVPLGDHRVAGVLGNVAVRDVELGLGRSPLVRGRAGRHPILSGSAGIGRPRPGSGRYGADHHVTEPEFDGGGCSPHHPHRACATEIDSLGEVDPPTAVLGDRRRDEVRGFAQITTHEAIDLVGGDSGVSQGQCCEVRPLLQLKRPRAGVLALAFPLGPSDDRCVTTKSHGAILSCRSPNPETRPLRYLVR